MSAVILIIEYELGETQRQLPLDAWRARAQQIASMNGLRWKYWLKEPESSERGGVYLFETKDDAEHAEEILVGSLAEAGARNIRHRVLEVDPELSAITIGRA